MIKILQPNPKLHIGLDVIRILTGGIIIFFGIEILSTEQMAGYIQWLTEVGMPLPKPMAYIGKLSELICGAFLLMGLFTRLSTIPLMITMCVVNFIMLDGSILTQPFYLLLLFACFFFIGSGKLSVDFILSGYRSSQKEEIA